MWGVDDDSVFGFLDVEVVFFGDGFDFLFMGFLDVASDVYSGVWGVGLEVFE